jgi:tetratricopeptide (TPR) repeat protein
MGDGIMALFGAPLAHEDHALRACYAALRMQESIRRYTEEMRRTHGVEVQIRVGLNAGEVVVRSIGNDLRMDYSAVGQTTHLAARMEQLATPGTIRLAADTLALVEGYVSVRPLGPVPVRGVATPIEVFELTGAATAKTRLQATRARGFTRFVGRDTEMNEIRRAADEARRGRGQIVAVVGEPGVGKSRLFYEFLSSHVTHGWRVLESGSVSYGKATPYLPLADLLRAYFRIETADDVRAIRAKVTGNVLTLDEVLKDAIPSVLWLLDALPEGSAFLDLDAAERRRRTLADVKALLLRESRVQPMVVVFEDLHWLDSETQAFLDSLVDSIPAAPIVLAVNYRPEYSHGWGSRTYYRQLRIDPLPPESASDLLDSLLGPDASVAPLEPLLIARTEGNPLFLEESVRTLVETGALAGQRGAYRLVKALSTVTVPATVQAILAARIDRLSADDKRLLQAAAVVGKDVPFALLLAVADLPEDELRRALGRLQISEFLYEARLFPELEYTFKHALTHEVAYGSLLSERRRTLHGALVGAMEKVYADRLDQHVERIAHHAQQGRLLEPATIYLYQAGMRAAARNSNREAVGLFDQAITIAAELPETRETLARLADLHLARATSLAATSGPGAPEVEPAYVTAHDLAVKLGESGRRFLALWGMWFVNYGRGRQTTARSLGEQLLAVAETDGDSGRLLEAAHAMWATLCAIGANVDAMAHFERGLALYDPARHGTQASIYGGHDAGSCCHYHLGRTQWFLGFPDRARARLREAIESADRLGHPLTMIIGRIFAAETRYIAGDYAGAHEHAERALEMATTGAFSGWTEDGRVVLACVAARERDDARALDDMYVQVTRRLVSTVWRRVMSLILMSEVLCERGDLERATGALDAIPYDQRDLLMAPEIRRTRAEICVRGGARGEAERWYRDAIHLAQARAERLFELRAATGLSRLLASTGRRDEARRGLDGVYARFTEGFDTADLVTARTLLDELGGPLP